MPNNVDGFTPLPAEPGLYDQLIDQQLHDQLSELAQERLWADIKYRVSLPIDQFTAIFAVYEHRFKPRQTHS